MIGKAFTYALMLNTCAGKPCDPIRVLLFSVNES